MIFDNLLFWFAVLIDICLVAVFNHLNMKSIINDPIIAIKLDIPEIEYANIK